MVNNLGKCDKNHLERECEKLDITFEQEMADIGLDENNKSCQNKSQYTIVKLSSVIRSS